MQDAGKRQVTQLLPTDVVPSTVAFRVKLRSMVKRSAVGRGVGSLFFHYISEKMYYLFERSLLAMVAGSRAARLLADLLGRSQILGVR